MSDEPAKFLIGDTAISAVTEHPDGKRGIFGRKRRAKRDITHCENCGAELKGKYCAQCGQAGVDYRRSFRHVILDVLDSFLNWDSKFFASIGLLIVKPWRLTNNFLSGQRVRYVHPLRLYLLASIVFFFAATYWIKSAHIDPFDLSPAQRATARAEIKDELTRENISAEVQQQIDQALSGVPLAPARKAKLEKKLQSQDLSDEEREAIQQRLEQGELPDNAREKIEEAMKILPPNARTKVEQALKKPGKTEEVKPVQLDNDMEKSPTGKWLQKRAEEKFGEHGTKIQLFLVTLVSNLPYMMLACIPLFALVLKILYVRRRIFYIDHLVYSLHIHTFAYLSIMLIILITLGLNRTVPGVLAGWIIALLWMLFAVQIFLSIRRVYRQGWFISIVKFLVGGFVYLIVLFTALATTFIITVIS